MKFLRLELRLCAFFFLFCCIQGQPSSEGIGGNPARRKKAEPITKPNVLQDSVPAVSFSDILARADEPEGGVLVTSFGGVSAVNDKLEISHPYTVSLRRRSDLSYFCAGVLISTRYVLTAAHCVDSSRTSADNLPEVVVGSISSTKTSGSEVQVISTTKVFIHPQYLSRRFPDLAIVKLAEKAKQDPVQLPRRFFPKRGKPLDTLGWGRQSSRAANAELVQITSMDYVTRKACARRVGRPIRKHHICMGGGRASSCEGDNGGPVIFPARTRRRDILVGIVGAVHVCGKSSKPDIHTNIWPYMKWIKKTAEIS